MHRIFVVGCPRSGTTLAQALIASHPELATLPETHFFTELPHRWRVGRLVNLTSAASRERLRDLASSLGFDKPPERTGLRTVRAMSRDFTALLDRYARREGSNGWVEKTPYHVRRIAMIGAHVPGARFCHVLRRGPQTVASLYAATQEHPEAWGGRRGLERCVDRWLADAETSLSYVGEADHTHLLYGELVDEPRRVVEETWERLGLPPASLERSRFDDAKQDAEPEDAPWQRLGEGVDPDRANRTRDVLAPEEEEWMRETLLREGRRRELFWNGRPLFR